MKRYLLTTLFAAAAALAVLGCKTESEVTGLINTSGGEVPAAPSNLSASAVTASTLTLTWTDNADNEIVYNIDQCSGLSCTTFSTASGSPKAAGTTTIAISGLSSGTIYRFRISAVNSYGTSDFLTSGDITTSSVLVSDPSSLAAVAADSNSIAVSWADNATNETGYEVDKCTGSGCSTYTAVTGSPFAAGTTSVTVSGLTASSTYGFRVRAVNSGSSSAYVLSGDVKTAPAAPTAFTTGTLTSSTIPFGWTDNGSDETEYQIQKCAGTGCTSFATVSASPRPANTVSLTESSLTESSVYRFRVRAISAAGNSAWLTSGDISTLIAAPTGMTVGTTTDTTIQFSWTDASSAELIYQIQSCTGTGCSTFTDVTLSPRPAGTTTLTLTGLTDATIYRLRVRAQNSSGNSDWLTSGDVTTSPVTVTAPSSLAVSSKTSTSITMGWVDNASNETGYEIESCTGASCSTYAAVSGSPIAANSTSTTISSLSPSTTYRIRVRAVTAGSQSSYVTSTDITTPPAAPTALVTGTITTSSIGVSWTDNASDEITYEIEKCSGASCTSYASASNSPKPANTVTYTESSLTENTIYRFRVRATSSAGSSPYLTSSDLTTLMAPPTTLVAGTMTDTTAGFSWTDNSATETGYDVEKCTGSGCSVFTAVAGSPLAANTIAATVSSLSPSTTYRFRVRAAGSVPSTYLTSGDLTTAPAPPTSFTNGTISYNSVQFTWTDAATDETSYTVERCTGSGCSSFSVLTSALAANTATYTDSSVSGSTTYKYRVKAVNSNGSSSYLTSGNITTTTTPTSALACTSPNTVTLDYGQQLGASATSARGIWSDVKYIPSGVTAGTGTATGNVVTYSTNAGVAYVDTGAQALKYSYWNGQVFKTEVVYGDSAANIVYVRLGYLSNSPNTGIPIIFFSNTGNSGQIMMAVRSTASLTATGTWTVTAIDAGGGTTNRALELSISPIDQVGLIYQGVTAPTANNIRFVYCSSSCNDASNYVSSGTAGTSRIDAGATATQTKLGLGWCQMSSGVYNPAVVYGVTTTTYQFAICKPGTNTLSTCTSNANWVKTTTTIPATGASGTASDLYLDPSISGDIPKIVVKDVTGGGLRFYSTNAACNLVGTATTYTSAGTAIIAGSGAAAIGNSWFRVLKSADYATATNERYFLVANDAATNMKWSASTNSTFLGTWFANTASSIYTGAINAAGGANMGADLNATSKQLITAFGTQSAAFNITLGVLSDYTSPGDPTSANNIYFSLPVEGAGHIQLNATQYQNIAIASTSSNKPGVAWVDFSTGAATTGKLKYALRSAATAASGVWNIITVPGFFNAPAPQYPSLAYDHNDLPWIGYWDAQAAGAGRFILATNTASDGTGTWTSYMFPVIAAGHGAPAVQPAANMPVVAMSYTAGVASPVMIVIDNGTTLAVKSAKLNPATGAWSAITTIETLAAQGGSFLTADWLTGSNTIAISYQVLTTGSVRTKYAASTDGGLTWPTNSSAPYPLSGLAQGEGNTLKINPSTSKPAVAYYDRANNRLYFAKCTANCTGSSAPTFSGTASAVMNGIGIAGLSAAGNYNLLTAALTHSAAGDAYILYNSGVLDVGALRLIDNVGGTMPSGLPLSVVSGINGAFTNAAATNGGIPWAQRSVRLSNGVLATAYVAPGNYLNVTTCGD